MDVLAHAPTALEAAGERPLPPADELAGRFPLHRNEHPASEDDFRTAMSELAFGERFADHMARMVWRADEGWSGREVTAYAPLSLWPSSVVLHYGQSVFEGLKAYRHADGSVWTFRPGFNAARLNASARRLSLPEVDTLDFAASIVDAVRADAKWVPSAPGSSLYLRPLLFGTEDTLGIHSSAVVTYLLITSPSGPYFAHGFEPVSIWVTRRYHRSGPGGTGAAKTGGNYASSLVAQREAAASGFDQVCYLDAREERYVEELGGMNVFFIHADGSAHTPVLTDTILEGGTRSAICRLLRDAGTPVHEEQIPIDQLVADIESGVVTEAFACGTAAVVAPIERLASDDFDVEVPTGGPVTTGCFQRLTDIQNGVAPDPYGWTYRIC